MDVALAMATLVTFVDAVLLSNLICKGKINAPKDRRTVCVAEKECKRKYVSNWFHAILLLMRTFTPKLVQFLENPIQEHDLALETSHL